MCTEHHLCSAPTLDAALPLADSLFFCLPWLPVDLLSLSSFLFPAVAGVMLLLSAMAASRGRSHGYATTSDLGVAVARKIIQVNMAHRALNLINVESRVSVHHLGILILRSKPLYTEVLNSSVGDGFAHLLKLCTGEGFLHGIIIRISFLFHRGVHQFIHGRTNDLVRHLLVFADELE